MAGTFACTGYITCASLRQIFSWWGSIRPSWDQKLPLLDEVRVRTVGERISCFGYSCQIRTSDPVLARFKSLSEAKSLYAVHLFLGKRVACAGSLCVCPRQRSVVFVHGTCTRRNHTRMDSNHLLSYSVDHCHLVKRVLHRHQVSHRMGTYYMGTYYLFITPKDASAVQLAPMVGLILTAALEGPWLSG